MASAPITWGQPSSSGQINIRSAALTRSSGLGRRSAVSGSAPRCIPLVVLSSSERADPDCHTDAIVPLPDQAERSLLHLLLTPPDHVPPTGSRTGSAW